LNVRVRAEDSGMGTLSPGAVTLTRLDDRFPAGTLVTVYPRGAKPPAGQPAGPPGAASIASGTVAGDGSLSLSALPDYRFLTAYALVGGRHVYVDVSTWPAGATRG
jgi:hypothetical protein